MRPDTLPQADWQYDPLQSDEIRLLDLGPANSPFCPSLTKASLKASPLPSFVALSYVWGDATTLMPLEMQGGTMCVTKNLHDALHHIAARPDRPRRLWIDAICINQSNYDERTAQVAQMGSIYSLASHVLVFLSSTSAEHELGIRFLEEVVSNPDAHYELSLSPILSVLDPKDETTRLTVESVALRTSLVAFFAAPWWTRVWTVQEFLLAKHVVFQCGSRRVAGETVTSAFETLRRHEGGCCWGARVRRLCDTEAPSFIDEPNPAHGGLSIYHATMRLDRLSTLSDLDQVGYNGLLGSLMLFRTRQCTNASDRIFGFMGLGFDEGDVSRTIELDYRIPAGQLYESVTVSMIETSQSLDVLSHVAGLKGQLGDLPSWVPDWTARVDDAYHLLYSSRVASLRLFAAAGDSTPDWNVVAPGTVKTKALILGTITNTTQGYPEHSSSQLTGQALLNEWWTLALPSLTRELDGHPTDAQLRFQFIVLTCGSLNPGLDWVDDARFVRGHEAWCRWFAAEDPRGLPEEVRADARTLDTHVRGASAARRMVRTGEGHVGFGPEGAREGDVVVIMPGGRMVYVLRREKGVYGLVGDCYLHGAMSGEKMRPMNSNGWKDIILV